MGIALPQEKKVLQMDKPFSVFRVSGLGSRVPGLGFRVGIQNCWGGSAPPILLAWLLGLLASSPVGRPGPPPSPHSISSPLFSGLGSRVPGLGFRDSKLLGLSAPPVLLSPVGRPGPPPPHPPTPFPPPYSQQSDQPVSQPRSPLPPTTNHPSLESWPLSLLLASPVSHHPNPSLHQQTATKFFLFSDS